MKNALQYYYHLSTDNIHQMDGVYKFTIQDQYYAFYPYDGDLNQVDTIYHLSINLWKYGIYCHQIVLNSEQKIVTIVNDTPYILIKSNYAFEEKITMEHLISFSNMTSNIPYQNTMRHDNWEKLWSEKIDYFEYQVNQFGKSHPIIRDSFSYFVGIAETGISLLNQTKLDYKNLVVSHKRIKRTQTVFDLYNPLSFIVDLKIRDACEYFKESFMTNENIWDDIEYYLTHNTLTSYEYLMFFIRMLYPSFYFDLYEDIMHYNKDEKLLIPVIEHVEQYEKLLKKLYIHIGNIVALPEIEWLKKI